MGHGTCPLWFLHSRTLRAGWTLAGGGSPASGQENQDMIRSEQFQMMQQERVLVSLPSKGTDVELGVLLAPWE